MGQPCASCGEPIPQDRLNAMPGTQVCVACATEMETPPRAAPHPRVPPGKRTCHHCP